MSIGRKAARSDDRFVVSALEARFPKGGALALLLKSELYARVKDDPRYANIEIAEAENLITV